MTAGQLITRSHAHTWQALHADIQRLFAAARHRHLQAHHWQLKLILDPRLLPVGQPSAPPELLALHAALDDDGLAHAVHTHLDGHGDGGEPGHHLIFHYTLEKNQPACSKPSGFRYPPHVSISTQPGYAPSERHAPPPGTPRQPITSAPETTMPDFTIRPTTPANPQPQEQAAMPHDRQPEIAKRSLFNKLEELIFGKPHDAWHEPRTENPPPDPVPQAPVPLLQAINNAITDATARFIRDYVAPLHADDPQTGFLLRSIEVAIPDNNLAALRVIAEMPAETRNRIAQTRCLKAHGAKEQLVFDQFYGLNVVASDTLVEGFLLRTLVATEGSRLNLTFRFSGDYVSIPDAALAPIPDEMVIPDAGPTLQLVRNADSGTRIRPPRPAEAHKGTRIRPPRNDSAQALFYVTVVQKAGEQRVPVDIKMLPLTIGTAPKHGRGITLHPEPSADSFVSGEHLELIDYNPTTQLLYVNNKGRNGTYEGSTRLAERFTLKPASQKLLTLGGPEGEEGVLQVRIEAA